MIRSLFFWYQNQGVIQLAIGSGILISDTSWYIVDDAKSRGDRNRNWPSRRCGLLNARSTEIRQDTNISSAFNWKASTHLDLLLNIICNIFGIIRMDWTWPVNSCVTLSACNLDRVNRQVLNLLVACGADSRLLRSDFMRGNPISVGARGLAHHQHQASESYQEESTPPQMTLIEVWKGS